jgi:sugar lactone lactonase YvrE
MKTSAAEPRILLTGLVLGESPRWHEDRLWFSDWGTQEIRAVDLDGRSEVITQVKSFPFSIDWLPDGRLLIVSASDRTCLCRESDGSLWTYAELKRLCDRPWNEIVVDGRGNVYLNSIGFEMMTGEKPVTGVVALVTPDGSCSQVADGVAFPNGMVVTPDNSTLILAESYGKRLTAFDIAPDGSLSKPRVWAEVDGAPDGLCLDADGAIWYADVPNKRCVRIRKGGEVLQAIELDRGCFACMLGGRDRKTLFMLAAEWRGPSAMAEQARTGQVLTVAAPAPGVGWP